MAATSRAQTAAAARPGFTGTVGLVEAHDIQRHADPSPCRGHFHHEFANAETHCVTGLTLGDGMMMLLE